MLTTALFFLLGLLLPAQADILVATNSVWKFRKGTNEVSSPLDAWRAVTFNDANWPSARAPFHVGENLTGGTLLSDMVGTTATNYSCVFLRQTFVLTNASDASSLTLRASVDDGFVMWLNGREAWRFNVPSGTLRYTNVALGSAPDPPPVMSTNLLAPTTWLIDGVNVLAIQAFNRLKDNADFRIDAELSAVITLDKQPPTIVSVSPAPGSTVNSLSQITVTFSEPVVGVQASDLIVNEVPIGAKSGASATYTFSFSQPPPGLVAVDFDADTGITDLAGSAFDPFAANASWTYTLADTVPPSVRTATPVAGATIGALTQVEVVFTEAVTGVDAADLLVNGQAATGVTASAPDTFLFQLDQPAPGAVTMSWAGNHGIRDLSPAANNFGGTGWSYSLNPGAATGDVVINEFLTDNLSSIADEDGQKQDWIELYNRGANAVNLLGWSLSDDPLDPGKWTFPAITLNPSRYLVVYASGKDRKTTAATGTNHANFRLGSSSYLGLYNAQLPRVAISEFAPVYPDQRSDISYGLTAGGTPAYFSTLTPGGPNSTAAAVLGFAQPPHASAQSGFFNHPFSLTLSTETPGATIRYTLDGSPPAESSAEYTAAIAIAGTAEKGAVILRAAAFKPGLLSSSITTRTYIFPNNVLTQPANPAGFPAIWNSPCTVGVNCNDAIADYEMDPQVINDASHGYGPLARQGLLTIPTISIVTRQDLLFGPAQGVYVRREPFNHQQVNVELILPDGSQGFNVTAGLEVVGGTSPNDQGSFWKSRKLSMRLLFSGEFGPTKLHYKVFPDSPVEDFDTLMVDAGSNLYWSYNGASNPDDQRQRSQYVRDQFMADLETAMGRVGPHGRFVHVYLNGLYWGLHDLHERPDHSFSAEYFGGDKREYDSIKHRVGTVVNGSAATYNAMFTLAQAGLADNAAYETLQQQYLDLPWFIDYMMMNLWAGNEDWAHQNWYASRRRVPGAGWRFFSWDAEHVMKGVNYNAVTDDDGVLTPTRLFQLLRANAEFRLRFADHVHRHFFNGGVLSVQTTSPISNDALLAQNRPAALYMKRINEIDPAIVTESARWGDTGETGTPRANNPLTRDVEWMNELNALMGRSNLSGYTVNYFPQRSSIVLNQFRSGGLYPANQPPLFSQHGGAVAAGYSLYMTNVSAGSTIYYTTNGADPRVYGLGAVSPQARIYTGAAVALAGTTTVKVRTLAGSTWSALNEATFTVAQLATPLRITEIMYNPSGGDAYEFIELLNAGAVDLDLSGYAFDGITFVFPPGSVIVAGTRVVLASGLSANAFAARYPGVAVFGYYSGSLANGGERLAIKDLTGKTITSADYDDESGWPTAPDGGGYSLEISDPNGDPDDPANWHASASLNGSSGSANSSVVLGAVVINEIMADNVSAVNNGGTFPDWIELYNRSAATVDLSGWRLASFDGTFRQFVFPNNTRLNPGAYLVIWCDQRSDTPGLHTGFALGRKGENVFLFNTASNRVDAVTFGLQVPNLSVGRVDGAWQLTQPTANGPNLPAQTGSPTSLVINEWLANPLAGSDDWIELYNSDASRPVALSGVYLSTSNALFQITSLSFIAPRSTVQLFADETPGPDHLDFKLSKDGDRVTLYDAAGLQVDRVSFGVQREGVSQGRLPDGSANIVSFSVPTPGAGNYQVSYIGPILNELMARNESAVYDFQGNTPDWIELYNPNSAAFNLSGMSLSDDFANAGQWLFPANTVVAANSYLVVWFDSARAATNAGPNLNTGRALNGDSGGVYLFNVLGQLVDSVEYGFQVANLSIGKSGGQWQLLATPTPSAANSASATLGAAAGLRINEWMALPLDGDDWFELYNANDQPLDLGGLYLTDDPSLVGQTNSPIAPLTFIAPHGWVKWVADGNPSQGRDHVNFSLDAQGETIALYDANHALIDAVYFGGQSTNVSQGRLPDGAAEIVSFVTTPTPGAANYLELPNVVINEILTHTDPPLEDAVELFNPSNTDADISGWFLSNSESDFKKYRFPANTIVPARGYKVIYQNTFDGGAGSVTPFTFNSAHGDAVYLSAADGTGGLTGYRAVARFGAAANGISFGRYQTSVGVDFVAPSRRTFGMDSPATLAEFRSGSGASNDYPLVGPIVINEIMYHPVTGTGANVTENPDDEYLELRNISASVTTPYDTNRPANSWRLRGAVEFDFSSVALSPDGYLLVVRFDPTLNPAALAAFRGKYGVPSNVLIVGPFSGRLANTADSVELYKPDPPQLPPHPDAGFVPYILVERVLYTAASPWPTNADGGGASLQRQTASDYGNDPVNWFAAAPTPGRVNATNSTDSDGDGLPNDWEVANGLNPTDPTGDNGAAGDPDGDGMTNLQEYLAGTNPKSASSRLAIDSISWTSSAVTLSFEAVANRSYTIEYRSAAEAGQWIRLADFPAQASTHTVQVTDSSAPVTTARFYRLVTPRQP